MKTIKKASLLFASLALVLGAGLVGNSDTKEVKAAEDEVWNLVVDSTSLSTGDTIFIAAKDSNYALSTKQNDNNRGQADITKDTSNNTATPSATVQRITLETGTKDNTFAFQTGSGYLFAASSKKNYLRTDTSLTDNGSWSIAINSTSGAATIKANGTYTRNVLKYNSNTSGGLLFSCYASGQSDVVIYKLKPTATVEITKVSATNVTVAEGKTAKTTLTYAPENTTQKTFKYKSRDLNIATVDENSGLITGVSVGETTITVTSAVKEDVSTTFTVTVTEKPTIKHAGTADDPYTVADAILKAEETGENATTEAFYVKGIVSSKYSSSNREYPLISNGTATFNMSDDGTTNNEFVAFKIKNIDGKTFDNNYADNIVFGDTKVVAKGNIVTFKGTTPEFVSDNSTAGELVSITSVSAEQFVTDWAKLRATGEAAKEGICYYLSSEHRAEMQAMIDRYDELVKNDVNKSYIDAATDIEGVTIGETIAYVRGILEGSTKTSGEYGINSGVVITSNNSYDKTSLIALFAILGIVTISGYYIIEKKKFSK